MAVLVEMSSSELESKKFIKKHLQAYSIFKLRFILIQSKGKNKVKIK